MTMTATNQKILEAAALSNQLEQMEDESEELERVYGEYNAVFSQLSRDDIGTMMMAKSLLNGKPYSLVSDNTDSIRRTAALALEMGATVKYGEGLLVEIMDELDPTMTSITIW